MYVTCPSVLRLLTGVPVSRRRAGGGVVAERQWGLEGGTVACPPARTRVCPSLRLPHTPG